jgi:hypothetical protein
MYIILLFALYARHLNFEEKLNFVLAKHVDRLMSMKPNFGLRTRYNLGQIVVIIMSAKTFDHELLCYIIIKG